MNALVTNALPRVKKRVVPVEVPDADDFSDYADPEECYRLRQEWREGLARKFSPFTGKERKQ